MWLMHQRLPKNRDFTVNQRDHILFPKQGYLFVCSDNVHSIVVPKQYWQSPSPPPPPFPSTPPQPPSLSSIERARERFPALFLLATVAPLRIRFSPSSPVLQTTLPTQANPDTHQYSKSNVIAQVPSRTRRYTWYTRLVNHLGFIAFERLGRTLFCP